MAVTTYGVGDSLTAKRWSRRLETEALMSTEIAPLIGESSNAIIHRKDEPKREKGDQVTIALRTKLFGDGVSEGQTLEGNEESLTTYAQALVLNEIAHAVRVKGERTIDAQRILFDMRKEAKDGLKDWIAERLSIGFFLHACGYTGATYTHRSLTVDRTKTVYNLGNTVTAHTTNRKLFAAAGAGESNTTDEGIESDDVFDLSLIDYAKEKARTAGIPLRPARVDGGEFFVMYLHPYQVTDLRRSTDTGQWMDFMRAAYTGRGKDSPLFSGALGMYNGVILHEAVRVTRGVNSTTGAAVPLTRRAVLCGAQAAAIGFGQDYSFEKFDWNEELFDYGNQLGVEAGCIYGLKKLRFNGLDFSTIVFTTYSNANDTVAYSAY